MRIVRKWPSAVLMTVLGAVATAGTAGAAPGSPGLRATVLDCGSAGTVTVLLPADRSADQGGWSVARIEAGGSGVLIPTAIELSLRDVTAGVDIFDAVQTKGDGHANHLQPTISCSQTTTLTLGEVLQPGDGLPAGTSPDDIVAVTMTATAVQAG